MTVIGENEAGPAVTGESIASPELTRGLPDQSLPRSPEGPRQALPLGLLGSSSEDPSFTQWWREYQERQRDAFQARGGVPEVTIAEESKLNCPLVHREGLNLDFLAMVALVAMV